MKSDTPTVARRENCVEEFIAQLRQYGEAVIASVGLPQLQ
jgi:hypothetical protein